MLLTLILSASMKASPICTRLAVPMRAIRPLEVMTREVPAREEARMAVLMRWPCAVPEREPVRCIPLVALPVLETGRMIWVRRGYRVRRALSVGDRPVEGSSSPGRACDLVFVKQDVSDVLFFDFEIVNEVLACERLAL